MANSKDPTEIRHVGIILDGNRRYARSKGWMPWDGHSKGADNVKKLLQWARDLGLKELTLYCFSVQNFNRSEEEKKFLFKIFMKAADEMLKSKEFLKEKCRVKVCGRTYLLPDKLQEKIKQVEEKTKDFENYQLNLCIAYGGREEITDAFHKVIAKVENGEIKREDVNEDTIEENLYVPNAPDFIIRTSGEKRSSNFLPWQSTYSEWFYPKETWPEFSKELLEKCMEEFREKRQRRFGK